ncbi:hypothetical protein [Endozoicomonas sp. 8E]|uniref:hypothetical protein n=1 Tax=Endozoicomonas sp. 8E TaxID=3035692 RepID=UPI002939066C|nr:hypothetical protein [Endozoicomonas sp. 8E]WOG27100.1 hypothetical protein P6910_21495 [Endozoicomonas sp. 8E]
MTLQDSPFAIITSALGSGGNPTQYQSSELSSQQAPETLSYVISYLASLLYSGSSGGNETTPTYAGCKLLPLSL